MPIKPFSKFKSPLIIYILKAAFVNMKEFMEINLLIYCVDNIIDNPGFILDLIIIYI